MKKTTKARTISSKVIRQTLDQIDPIKRKQIRNRMEMAMRIDEAMKAIPITKAQLAERLDKQPSQITRWLSGTHNFTQDTISMLEIILEADLLIQKVETIKVVSYEFTRMYIKHHVPISKFSLFHTYMNQNSRPYDC